MKKLAVVVILLFLIPIPVSALEYTVPKAPDSAQPYMAEENETFAEGLWFVIKSAVKELQPCLAEAGRVCFALVAVTLLVSMLQDFSGISKQTIDLVAVICVASTLMQSTTSMIQLGAQTVTEISDYGKLLLPVMTASLAAQGGTTSSASLYAGTTFFNTILSTGISKLIIPMIYVNTVLSIAHSAIGEQMLKNIKDFTKWLITWSLKIILYVFTGYLGITGVVSGTTDAATLKAMKLTVSGVVPVVGSIVSDASETILVSAGVLKNTAGVYGLLVIAAIWIGPFIKIGVQYLLLKIISAACGMFCSKNVAGLIKSFSDVMGILVAMTGTVCLLLLVSIVCFLKGVG